MNGGRSEKVTTSHLARDAYLYIRHATPRQDFQNAETVQRRDDLREQAVALGWPVERVIFIDGDVGQSGASQRNRPEFGRLMRQLELACVGIVMALEPSRLTRNIRDWHRLLDACALNNTLLLVQDGLYDPADSHDRALLGGGSSMLKTADLSGSKEAFA